MGLFTEENKTPWMDWLTKNKGQHEVAGSEHNPWIVSLFKHTTYKAKTDETPWCAACACAALEETGYKSTRSAAAKSYDTYGSPADLRYGAIITIKHPSGGRHVTFFHSFSTSNVRHIYCIGGNQNNAITIKKYDLDVDTLMAVRWPVKAT